MKHCKLAIDQLKKEIPGLQITLLRQRTHLIYELKLGNKVRRMPISASPKNCDHTIENAIKQGKRLMEAGG